MSYQLFIGNKNYSTWSMRPWILLKQLGIPFQEHLIQFDSFEPNSQFKTEILKLNSTGKVPTLMHDDLIIWDSLAICEYIAEQNPEKNVLPEDRKQRARARCISAEMHSSFQSLRNLCPMNVEADLAYIGQQLWLDNAQLRADVARIEQIWSERPAEDSLGLTHKSKKIMHYSPENSITISGFLSCSRI